FNSYSISLSQFVRAYRRARETVPSHYEKPLIKLLINKLRNRVKELRSSILDADVRCYK
ncbi:hypothetical protein ALC53_00755, partial [Atta colombica]